MMKQIPQIKTKEDIQVVLLITLIIFVLFVKVYMVILQQENKMAQRHSRQSVDYRTMAYPSLQTTGGGVIVIK